jgi:hypothetical protein
MSPLWLKAMEAIEVGSQQSAGITKKQQGNNQDV